MGPIDFLVHLDMMNTCTEFRFSMSICGEGMDVFHFSRGRYRAILPRPFTKTIKYQIFRQVWLALVDLEKLRPCGVKL